MKECAMDRARYDRLAILFHWVMAALIFYAAASILIAAGVAYSLAHGQHRAADA